MTKSILCLTFILISFVGLAQNRILDSINFQKMKGKLPWPVEGGIIVGRYTQDVKYKGNCCACIFVTNDGINLKTDVGASVRCVADGEVAAIMNLDSFMAVMVKHGKYFTIYNMLMLSSVTVKTGDRVNAGTILGKVAANLDGEGEMEFEIYDIEKQFHNPEDWLIKTSITKTSPQHCENIVALSHQMR